MTGRQMIAVGVRDSSLLAESSIDSRGQDMQQGGRSCAERRKKPREQGNSRAAAAAQNEAEESDATEEEATRESTSHDEKGATARWHESCSENRRETAKRDRKRRTPKGGRRLAHHTPLLKIPVWWRRAVLPSLPLVVCFLSFLGMGGRHAATTQEF